jgi:hypothetical protein
MATTAQLNAVYDAIKADADQLIDDLVPSFLKDTAAQEITVARVMKFVNDAVSAYEKLVPSKGN